MLLNKDTKMYFNSILPNVLYILKKNDDVYSFKENLFYRRSQAIIFLYIFFEVNILNVTFPYF